LGPDTTELGIRVRLRGGPVTSGVLRGENAPFQLFGDTMGTTARVETTGAQSKIYIVNRRQPSS
jgi:class 3 adenylate cyclase